MLLQLLPGGYAEHPSGRLGALWPANWPSTSVCRTSWNPGHSWATAWTCEHRLTEPVLGGLSHRLLIAMLSDAQWLQQAQEEAF